MTLLCGLIPSGPVVVVDLQHFLGKWRTSWIRRNFLDIHRRWWGVMRSNVTSLECIFLLIDILVLFIFYPFYFDIVSHELVDVRDDRRGLDVHQYKRWDGVPESRQERKMGLKASFNLRCMAAMCDQCVIWCNNEALKNLCFKMIMKCLKKVKFFEWPVFTILIFPNRL